MTCIALILVVLLQSSKGEGLAGSAFGGGVSGAVFGGRGAASFLSRATTVLAITFMVNCGALAFMSAGSRTTAATGQQGDSVVTRQAQQERERQLQQQQTLPPDAAQSGSEQPGESPAVEIPAQPVDTGQ